MILICFKQECPEHELEAERQVRTSYQELEWFPEQLSDVKR
jgi:hypothetical protein